MVDTKKITKKMTKKCNDSLSSALLQKATGLEVDEVVEEYCHDSETDDLRLVKRKVTKKQLPPDIQAVRALLEYYGDNCADEYSAMSDEELVKERDRLLKILREQGPEEDYDGIKQDE